jgi:hypothetical protein
MTLCFNKKYLIYSTISNIMMNYKYLYIFHNSNNLEIIKKYCLNNNIKFKVILKNFIHFNDLYSKFYINLFISSNFIIYSNSFNNIITINNKLDLFNNKFILFGLMYKNIFFNRINLSNLICKFNKNSRFTLVQSFLKIKYNLLNSFVLIFFLIKSFFLIV